VEGWVDIGTAVKGAQPVPKAVYRNVDRGVIAGARPRGETWGLSPPNHWNNPPPKHDGRSSAIYELPQKIFACWCFSHSRAGAAISRTLALPNSAGTNLIHYLLKVKVRTEWVLTLLSPPGGRLRFDVLSSLYWHRPHSSLSMSMSVSLSIVD